MRVWCWGATRSLLLLDALFTLARQEEKALFPTCHPACHIFWLACSECVIFYDVLC